MISLNNFRKGLISFLCAGAILAFASCGKTSQTSSNEDTLDRIRRTGQIDACTLVDPPFVIKDAKTGAISGIHIDAMNLIAEKMNAKVNWHETTYGNAVADLSSRRCDVVVAGFFAKIPRALTVAFTEPPIYYAGNSVALRKNDTRFKNIKTIFELDKPDITVAVATGETGDIFVKDNFKKARVKEIDVQASDTYRFFLEVSSGRADVAIAGDNTIIFYVKRHPDLIDLFAGRPFSLNPASWCVRQDDVKWLHFLETAIQFLDTQGTMAQLEKKYDAHLLHLVKQYKLQ